MAYIVAYFYTKELKATICKNLYRPKVRWTRLIKKAELWYKRSSQRQSRMHDWQHRNVMHGADCSLMNLLVGRWFSFWTLMIKLILKYCHNYMYIVDKWNNNNNNNCSFVIIYFANKPIKCVLHIAICSRYIRYFS